MKTPQITYRVKLKPLVNADCSESMVIDYKRKLDRRDCNLKPQDHTYYNSDLFISMLNGAYQEAIQRKTWCRVEQLPECVKLDTTGFLAEVTITLPQSFMR